MIKEKKIPYKVLNLINELAEVIKKEKTIAAFYIFGGAVEGSLKPLSDIDFAVLLNNKSLSVKDIFENELSLRETISNFLHTDEFDLVVLNSAPVSFAKNIICTGKILFINNKPLLIDFIERTNMQYLDFSYFRNQFLNEFMKRSGIK